MDAGVCGPHPRLGRDGVLAAARRLVGRAPHAGEPAVTVDEVTAALEAVAGPQGRRRAEIDPERTLEAATTAGAQLAEAAQGHRRVSFASAAPPSLLSLYAAAARAARGAGAIVTDADAWGPYASGRSPWWHDGVAVATDGRRLVDETTPGAAKEWLFAVGRPALAVVDGVFAEHATDAGVPTIAFADLDPPAPASAAARGRPVVVIAVALVRRPPPRRSRGVSSAPSSSPAPRPTTATARATGLSCQQRPRGPTLPPRAGERGELVAEAGDSFAKARFLTVQEVADLMRVSSMTVYRLIKAGDLPAVRVGRSFRVRDVDVDTYLSSRYTQAG